MGRPVIPVELTMRAFHLEEARHLGLTRDHLRGASWRRLGRGSYAWHEIAKDPLVALAAINYRLPREGAFSGRSAAWLHGLDVPPCQPIEVTIPPTLLISRIAGARVRRAGISAEDVCIRRGLRATSIVRTIADIGRTLPLVEGVAATDMALHRRLVRKPQLEAWIATHQRFPGIARLRRVIDLAEPATESVMETRLRLLLVLAGLPRPQAQVSLRDDEGRFVGRPDLYYPAKRLVLEYDGAGHRESLSADDLRQNRLVDAGCRILRFTAADVLSQPEYVIRIVGRALST